LDRYADWYSFSGTAGQQVAILLTSSAFDTYLNLIGPSGSVVAYNDDGGGGTNSRIPATSGYFSLPSSGTYIIEVTSYAANATGNYTLTTTTYGGGTTTNRLLNPSFESGSANWVQYSSSGYSIITNSTAVSARTGSWYAWFGADNNLTEYLYQDVTIPANATQANVEFWYQISTDEASTTTCYDSLIVEVRRPSDNALLAILTTLCNYNRTTTWTRSGPFDVLGFKGQTIRLRFYDTTDSSLPTSWFVDDVALIADGS
jgi:kumamolisin